jgi:hypothetical protein
LFHYNGLLSPSNNDKRETGSKNCYRNDKAGIYVSVRGLRRGVGCMRSAATTAVVICTALISSIVGSAALICISSGVSACVSAGSCSTLSLVVSALSA